VRHWEGFWTSFDLASAAGWHHHRVMAVRMSSWLARPWLLRVLWLEFRVALRLLREPRVPVLVKGLLPLAALYLLSPIDILPDFFPGLGQLDDIAIAIAAVKLFLKLCPADAVAFHQSSVSRGRPYSPMSPADVVVDAEYRRG
jgi:uncharacterized membrane protein YkvA (DUF1232 family)